MAHPYHHALSSVKFFGGQASDYQKLHDWFDESKKFIGNWRHRAMRHHAEGIFMAETIFGTTITNSDGKKVPTRLVAERHIIEDMNFIPSVNDWLKNIPHEKWMTKGVQKLDVEDMNEKKNL